MDSPSMSLPAFDRSSSPDPLASSPDAIADTTTSSRRTFASNNRKPVVRRQNKQRTSLESVSILPPSSPSRTVTEQTLSPWKIRVTVEAEPDDQELGPVQTMTRTMKVPVKGESSPTQPRRERSQSKSRKEPASAARRRSTTPMADRRRRQSVTDLDIVVLGDDADEDEWGRSKKKASPKKTRARKNSSRQKADDVASTTPATFDIRPDTDAENEISVGERDDSPELRQIDLNRVSVRSRTNSVKQKAQSPEEPEEEHPIRDTKPVPSQIAMGRRTVSANSMMSYPTPSPTASERGQSVEVEAAHEHVEGYDTIMESEGFTMIDLDSIPSVKQMLSSPLEEHGSNSSDRKPSSGVKENSSRNHASSYEPSQISPLKAIPPHLVLPEGESDMSCTVSSSPPTFSSRPQITRQITPLSYLQVPAQPRNRQVTPQPYASPRLPSPPRQSTAKDRSTPDSAKAMKAGLALQGALDPVGLNLVMPPQSIVSKEVTHARSSSDELFEGFDSSTKRELRAGLRFGEELAKRQEARIMHQQIDMSKSRNIATQVWRGESVLSRTPVQIAAEQGREIRDHPLSPGDSPVMITNGSRQSKVYQQEEDIAHQREREWQLEREAVSKQIQDASPSKVIVLGSDDEEQGTEPQLQTQQQHLTVEMMECEDDIWLEEARDSSSSPRVQSDESVRQFSQLSFNEPKRSDELTERPRRGVIPSPWKRGEQIQTGNDSTIVTNGEEMSGLFWKQAQTPDVQFGAAAINNIRREFQEAGSAAFMTQRTSGNFNIEKMLNTPKRIRDSIEKNQTQSSGPGSKLDVLTSDNDSTIEEETRVENSEEFSDSIDSSKAIISSSPHNDMQMVPVNFNDSFVSGRNMTPPQSKGSVGGSSPPIARPPTPRSAMKGSRQSFGAANGLSGALDESEPESRRVAFAERSRGVDVDWVESSSSVQLTSEDGLSSPLVEHQKHHEERRVVPPPSQSKVDHEQVAEVKLDTAEVKDAAKQPQQGWLGWLWKSKVDGDEAESEATLDTDGSSIEQTQPKASLGQPHSAQARLDVSQIPSYLLPPSYPSDPSRDPGTLLATSGRFTNTHFRTLHILHRKSQRPRFHAPRFSSCRPEIRDLATRKWKSEVDESDVGLGGFAWTVGETEARVLERFCREIEFGYLTDRKAEQVTAWETPGGIWSGRTKHGHGEVEWGWSVVDLATWFGRVVIGEVVREEEYGGVKYQP